MKAKKRIILVIVVLLLANLSCGVFSKGPEKTIESFFTAVDKGNIDKALGYLSYGTIQTLGYDKWRSALVEASHQATLEGEGLKRIKIQNETVNGDIARVTVEIFYEDGSSEVNTFDLIKEDNEWKIELDPWMK